MERELKNLAVVGTSVVASLCYTYSFASRVSPGMLRFLSLLPVLYLFTQLPFSFSTFHLRAISTFFLSWLGTFKLLLFSFQGGPLSDPNLSLSAFLAIAAFPIKLREQKPGQPNLPSKDSIHLLVRTHVPFAVKCALLAFLVFFYPERDRYPRALVVAAYTVHGYLGLDLVLSSAAAFSRPLLGRGMELEAQFAAPYLSSSLQDFWGRRWNLMVTRLLHQGVYAPVRSRSGPLAGTLAAFLVSGALHEAVVYYLTLGWPTGEATCFFLLQGVSVAVEVAAKAALGRKGWKGVPRAVAAPLTLAYVWGTAGLLFFPALLREREAEEMMVRESVAVLEAGKVVVGRVLGAFSSMNGWESVRSGFGSHVQ